MKHPASLGRKILRWVGAVVAVLALAVVVFTLCNWSYIKPVLQGLGVWPMSTAQAEDWAELEEEAAQDFASAASEPDAADAENAAPQESGSPAPELPEESEAPAESAAPEESPAAPDASPTAAPTAGPTATPTPAASESPAATPTQSPEASAAPAEPDYEAQVQQCIEEMNAQEKKFKARLYNIVVDAQTEYLELPESSRNAVKKVAIILSKKSALEAAEKECDAEVDEILTRMRAALAASGQDDTLATEAEKAYKQKKSAAIAELTKIAYSGTGNASGRGWLWEHADWAE
jgi:hypothetical protein